MIRPTGVGKSYLVRTLGELLDAPMVFSRELN
jgi:ATP-dependent protease Clp ATPase subunit